MTLNVSIIDTECVNYRHAESDKRHNWDSICLPWQCVRNRKYMIYNIFTVFVLNVSIKDMQSHTSHTQLRQYMSAMTMCVRSKIYEMEDIYCLRPECVHIKDMLSHTRHTELRKQMFLMTMCVKYKTYTVIVLNASIQNVQSLMDVYFLVFFVNGRHEMS